VAYLKVCGHIFVIRFVKNEENKILYEYDEQACLIFAAGSVTFVLYCAQKFQMPPKLQNSKSNHLTYFACPFDAFPYAEIAEDPDKEQSASQLPADAAHMFHTFRDLQRSAPAHTQCNSHLYCYYTTLSDWCSRYYLENNAIEKKSEGTQLETPTPDWTP
jgi:hypothetical protein